MQSAGFKVSYLGTGAGGCILRNHTAIVLECPGGERILLDAASGNTVLRHANRLGMSPVEFDHCLLTHSHPDHCEGLPHIEMQRSRRNAAERPMQLYGSGAALADVGVLLSYPRRGLAVDANGARRSDGRRVFDFRPADPGEWIQLTPGVRAKCAPVEHIGGAVAWRIEASGVGASGGGASGIEAPGIEVSGIGASGGGASGTETSGIEASGIGASGVGVIVFSGDTRWCPALAELAEGADLLIHEAICTEDDRSRADNAAHATAAEAGRIAQLAGVRQLTLTHIDNAFHAHTELLAAEARGAYDGGPVWVAADCWQQSV